MLKKINRSLKRSDFDASRNVGKMYQNPLFGVSVVKDGDDNKGLPVQIGFVISKKISKKAVTRNKIRRILADEIRKNLPSLDGFRGNLIFLIKTAILKAKNNEIETEVKNMLEKIINKGGHTGPPVHKQ